MQTVVLVVTLVLMAVVAVFFWRSVAASSGPPVGDTANSWRSRLIWVLTIAGVVISVASLREWPHAIASHEEAVVVNVTGGLWWWEIDAEEIPAGKPVVFHVTSEDVNHGMGVYDSELRLLFQTQGMPGYVNKVSYTFDEPGTYRVLCLEFCGLSHHEMADEFEVVAGQ